jgi:hypothetical protein
MYVVRWGIFEIKGIIFYGFFQVKLLNDIFFQQGTFSVYEKFQDVMDFVTENLAHQLPFVLYATGTGGRLGEPEAETTLMDLGLVPSSLLVRV